VNVLCGWDLDWFLGFIKPCVCVAMLDSASCSAESRGGVFDQGSEHVPARGHCRTCVRIAYGETCLCIDFLNDLDHAI